MTRKGSLLTRRTAGGVLALLATSALALGGSGAAFAAATESSTQTINSIAFTLPGTVTSSGGGVAVAGVPMAIAIPPIVVQGNIQVDTTGNTNNVQSATNDLTANQTTVASAGSATATNGGIAKSGTSTATSSAIVMQMNVQVITGFAPSEGVTQDAANVGQIDQTTVAASGETDADGEGSIATSGNASANSSTVLNQTNLQTYIGSAGTTTGTAQMSAANTAAMAQEIIAASGLATASDGGQSTTGSAANTAVSTVQQDNTQTIDD